MNKAKQRPQRDTFASRPRFAVYESGHTVSWLKPGPNAEGVGSFSCVVYGLGQLGLTMFEHCTAKGSTKETMLTLEPEHGRSLRDFLNEQLGAPLPDVLFDSHRVLEHLRERGYAGVQPSDVALVLDAVAMLAREDSNKAP